MNKKKIVFLLLALVSVFLIQAQNAMDVVLVVDNSTGMFSHYNEVSYYLSGVFLAENVRLGDTLHIISYTSQPRFEIARQIRSQGDVETVSARLWLLYPLMNNANPGSAISYAERYARDIHGNREKKVYVISNDDNAENLTSSAAERLKPAGIEVIFIRASSRMGRGGTSIAASVAAGLPASSTGDTANTSTAAAEGAASVTGTASTAASSGSSSTTGQTASSDRTTVEDGFGNENESTVDGSSEQDGEETKDEQTDDTTHSTEDTSITQDKDHDPSKRQTSGALMGMFEKLPFPPLLLGLLLLLLVILVIFIITRSLHSSPNKAMASGAARERHIDDTAARNAELLNSFASRQAAMSLQGPPRRYQYKDPGQFPTNPPMLNLFVEDQNTAIGKRNVHTLRKGSTYTVGGGKADDFYIFLVPLPGRLARLYFDGNNCTLTPLKPKYFPDIGSVSVHECIGKTIRLISDKSYEVYFHFERYKDPLIAMNQLLHSIEAPEPPLLKKDLSKKKK